VSPIHDAAAKGNVEGLNEIIQSGVDINSIDAANNTPLHWASGAGHCNAVRWLIENQADMTKKNLLGDTALHRSVWRGQAKVVAILLEKGIDVTELNKDGKKAIDLVRGNIEIGAMIQSADIAYQQNFVSSIYENNELGNYDISNDSEEDTEGDSDSE